jgi:hypothetical protein
MPFTPFDEGDFNLMATVQEREPLPLGLLTKIDELRESLGAYPEFNLRSSEHASFGDQK